MPNLSLNLVATASDYPHRPALRCDELEVTYRQFDAAVARVATFLEREGIEPGDRVGLMLPNTPAFAVAFYGILRRGAVAVPMNPLLKAREIAFYLTNTGAKALFATPAFAEEAAAGTAAARATCWLTDDASLAKMTTDLPEQQSPVERAFTDTAVILHTSGTTGKPKGAELTHGGLNRNQEVSTRTLIEVGPDDVIMGCLPLFHVFGMTCGLNAAVATAAVLVEAGKPFELMELDLDGPGPGEVLIKYTAAGLCHSDLHLTDGDLPPRFPIVGGHEGSGVIEEVGAGVTKFKPGDHVVCSFIPSCGTCRYCSTGRQNLCDMGATILEGCMPDGSFRFHAKGIDFGAMCILGTFAQRATISQHSVVKVDEWLPLETAVLVGCGVPSGWGTAINAGNLRAGDTAVIYGVGGLGTNAVQGAIAAGCKYVVVVDPVALKRETALKFGATHAFADAASAPQKVDELTWGKGADAALILVGTVDEEVVSAATAVIGKGGTVVITGLANPAKLTVHVSGTDLTLHEKTIKGSLFGSCNPQYDIVRLLRLYDAGQLKLDELVTATYTLEEVNQGYQDLRDGKNIRGVIVH